MLFLDKALAVGAGADQGALKDLGSLLDPLSVACASAGYSASKAGSAEELKACLCLLCDSFLRICHRHLAC